MVESFQVFLRDVLGHSLCGAGAALAFGFGCVVTTTIVRVLKP